MSGAYKNKCPINLSIGKRGLGPDFLGEVRHYLPYHISYHTPARFHDLAYEMGLISRKQADDVFYQKILKKEETKWATIYYLLVRAGGWMFYKKVKPL